MGKDNANATISDASSDGNSQHHHACRLRQFVHPSGRKIHIARNPEEQLRLNERRSSTDDFDVYLQGTPEHLDAIKELHSHHQEKRYRLRQEHGPVYDEFEEVKKDIDELSREFQRLTDHNVALEANFSKFGYGARLRTIDHNDDDDDSKSRSPSTGVSTRESSSDHPAADRTAMEGFKFWKRPVIRQYFHKDIIWRSARSGEVASFELFVDLVYVGVIDHIGEAAVYNTTAKGFLQFAITFSMAWRIWSDLTVAVNWFEIDDIFQRICAIFYVVCLMGFITNTEYAFRSTYTSMVAFYLTERLFAGAYYLWAAYLVPMVAATLLLHVFVIAFSAVLWIGSIHVDYPYSLILIFLALPIDIFGAGLVFWVMKTSQKASKGIIARIRKHFDFYPAVNIEHRVERNNALVTLVFGSSVLTIIFQSKATFGINAYLGKAILGLIQAFAFNWIYFEIDQFNLHTHAIRRHWFSSISWTLIHLPFIMGYVLAGATIAQLVLAHDFPNSDPEKKLGSHSVDDSLETVGSTLRWFYCGGLGVAIIGMAIVAMCHVHKKRPNRYMSKKFRLMVRCCIGIIVICLPLAESLNSLHLISITVSLVILILMIDIFGNTCAEDHFWSKGFCEAEKKKCQYSAECRMNKKQKKELEKALKRDTNAKSQEMAEEVKAGDDTEDNGGSGSSGGSSTLDGFDEEKATRIKSHQACW